MTAVARDSNLAAAFGATQQLDALLVGIGFVRTAGLQLAVVAASALVPALVPIAMAQDSKRIVCITGRWIRHSSMILVPLCALLLCFARPLAALLGPGFDDAGRAVLARTLAALAPLLLILSMAGAAKAVGDTYGIYIGHPTQLVGLNVGLIVGLTIATPDTKAFGAVAGLLAGGVAGLAAHAVLLVWRSPVGRASWRLRSTAEPAPGVQGLGNHYAAFALLLMSSVLVHLQGVVERAYASQLAAGSIVALTLALSVVGVPSALLLPAFSSALLPRLVRREQHRPLRYGLPGVQFTLLLVLFGLLTAIFWFGSEVIVKAVFLRGRFSIEAARLTSTTIRWLCLGFTSYALGVACRQVVIARGMFALDLGVSAVALLLELVLLKALVPAFGLKGILIEMILVSVATALMYLFLIAYKRLPGSVTFMRWWQAEEAVIERRIL